MTQRDEGYWGEVTGTYDWCERNYAVSYYVAEFWNTLSSLAIIWAAVYFYRLCVLHRYGTRLKVAAIGLGAIGVGSTCFHGTLLRVGQVLDEVPMLWSSLVFLWVTITIRSRHGDKASYHWDCTTGVAILLYGFLSTLLYFYAGFEFFLVSYIAAVAAVFILSGYVMVKANSNDASRRYLFATYTIYAGGFAFLWIPEQVLCGNRLSTSEESILLTLSVPLHAYFHVTSSIGPLCWLLWAAYNRAMTDTRALPIIEYRSSMLSCMIPAPIVKRLR